MMASGSISMLQNTASNEASDECYTPAVAIYPLLKYLSRDVEWYEATSGKSSAMIDVMRGAGFRVVPSHGDFLGDVLLHGGIVTNPPYSKKFQFMQKCFQSGLPFALLLPVTAFQGQKLGALYIKYGIDVLVLNKRVDFTGKKSPHFGVAWFTSGILPERLMFDDMEGEQ